jgi:hypothetical protein
VGPQLGADGEAALFLDFRVAQFLAACLDGEVGLALGDDLLGWIGILDDEVAGVAGHQHGLHRTLPAFADLDQLVGSDEMILFPLAAVGTGGTRLLNYSLKMAVVHVAEHLGEIPAGPEFVARRGGSADGFEGCDFLAHGGGT